MNIKQKKILFTSAFGITGAADDFVEDGAVFPFAFPGTVVQFVSLLGISIYTNNKYMQNLNKNDIFRIICEQKKKSI